MKIKGWGGCMGSEPTPLRVVQKRGGGNASIGGAAAVCEDGRGVASAGWAWRGDRADIGAPGVAPFTRVMRSLRRAQRCQWLARALSKGWGTP